MAQLQDINSQQFGEQLDRWELKLGPEQRSWLVKQMLHQSQRQTEPKIRWSAAECAALLRNLNRTELESLVDAAQLKLIDQLDAGKPLP
jgi:uncharacterized protein YfaT (DUF1175 family)